MFSVPGIIALFFRAQFIAGRMPKAGEGLISYVTLSLAYHALAFPLAKPIYLTAFTGFESGFGWFALIFVGPMIVGVLLGLNIRKGWTKKLVNRFKLSTIHPIGCAWDWHFGRCEECWVMVVLKDDTKWYGYISGDSFMSSEPNERDLYIEKVWDFHGEGKPWTPRNTSVWIAHGEVQSIEFFHDRGCDD